MGQGMSGLPGQQLDACSVEAARVDIVQNRHLPHHLPQECQSLMRGRAVLPQNGVTIEDLQGYNASIKYTAVHPANTSGMPIFMLIQLLYQTGKTMKDMQVPKSP